MKLQDITKRVDELIDLGQKALHSEQNDNGYRYLEESIFKEFRTASLSFILNIFGTEHPYYIDFDKDVNDAFRGLTDRGIGILKAIKSEIVGGWLVNFKGLVSAEIFSDFLEMAEYLLSENYKDASAVMIGSVLEEHLRQLCLINGIAVSYEKDGKMVAKKADKLNSELASANVYNKLDQKNITTQLDIRNKAAHGLYNEYTEAQVKLMFQSVVDIMSRNSI